MFCRNLIFIVLIVTSANCEYEYMRTPATLRHAYSICRKNHGTLLNNGEDLKRVLQNWNSAENTTIWTGNFKVLSPWISLAGCYRYRPRPDPNRTLVLLVNTSAAACGIHCSKYTGNYFALQEKRCLCVAPSDVLSKTDDNDCGLTCDGSPLSELCGSTSRQTWSLYSKVIFSRDTTNTSDHCIAGMCNRNGGFVVYGSDCSSSFKAVCSNGIQLDQESDWTSSLHTCISMYGLNLVNNMSGLCRNLHHYAWKKFWIGQFRGVAQHTGPDLPETHIVGCSLVTIKTNAINITSRISRSEGCETDLRPFVCKLDNNEIEKSSTFTMERMTVTYNFSTATPHTRLNSTIEPVSNSTNNRTKSPSLSLPNKDASISGGAVAAAVLTAVLCTSALASVLFMWRRKKLCFQNLKIGHNIGNLTYDPSFSSHTPDRHGDCVTQENNYDEIDDPNSAPCDDVEEDPFTTTDDVYAHPTFDYDVEDEVDENKQKSYLDMGASLPPQNNLTVGIDEEYVYMGDDVSNKSDDNEDEDMYSFIKS